MFLFLKKQLLTLAICSGKIIMLKELIMGRKVYLDNASTTYVSSEVLAEMLPCFNAIYGNSNSLHSLGVNAKKLEIAAGKQILEVLNLKNKDWLFDARILEVTKEETLSYFQARQAFAIDKYLAQLKGQYGIDYKLNKSSDIIEALKLKGVEYSTLNPEYAFGIMYSNQTSIKPFEFADDLTKLRLACFGK